MWLQHYDVEVLNAKQQVDLEIASAKHSGYNKIGCSHERTVEFDRGKEIITLTDYVTVDSKPHSILQPWHLHPEVIIEKLIHILLFYNITKVVRRVKIQFSELLNINIIKGQTEPNNGMVFSIFFKKRTNPCF